MACCQTHAKVAERQDVVCSECGYGSCPHAELCSNNCKNRAITPPDRLARVAKATIKQGVLYIEEIEEIKDVLGRARNHLSKGHSAIAAELMQQARDMLDGKQFPKKS